VISLYTGINLKLPLFEIGPKAYLYGKEVLELAKAADRISKKYKVSIIFTPQCVDISRAVEVTDNLYIFAQHMDSLEIGIGLGSVLPEALKAAGATGTLLNHAERKINLGEIHRTIKRADEVGLATAVCADSYEEVEAIAHLNPNIIIAEPPELIGTAKSVGKWQGEFISKTVTMIKKINSKIIVLAGAGIRTAADVREVIKLGADATGSTSGILKAKNPIEKMEEMIKALKEAWLETHS